MYLHVLTGLEDQLAETEVQVQHYRVEMESLTEQLRSGLWSVPHVLSYVLVFLGWKHVEVMHQFHMYCPLRSLG